MYVSGTLKNKTVNFYKEKMTTFDTQSISTPECNISYNGELTFAPWDQDKHQKLIKRQEQYLEKLSTKILSLFSSNPRCGTDYFYYTSEVKKVIRFIIQNTPRNMSFALLETLYTALKNCHDVIGCLNDFAKFVNYMLDHYDEYITQGDIDAIMRLFLKNQGYSMEKLIHEKQNYFHINEKMIDDSMTYQLYRLGEFIAPHRFRQIRNMIDQEGLSRYIVPIYFSILDEEQAKQFLRLCQIPELDFEQIEKNASLCRVPNNIIDMVRR